MATALYLWSAFNRKAEDDLDKAQASDADAKAADIAKPKSKRGGKSANPAQKKQPQRGLGVAQLERLRMQERWKSNEADGSQLQNGLFQFPFSFFEPQAAVPLLRSAPVSFPGFSGAVTAPDAGSVGSAVGSVSCGHSNASLDQFRAAAFEARIQNRSVIAAAESARELSSIQKTHCLSASCEFCTKKKRLHAEDLVFNGYSGRSAESTVDECYFLGRSFGPWRTLDEESMDFGEKRERRAWCFGDHIHVGENQHLLASDAVFVGDKSLCVSEPLEYDFFPAGKANRDCIHGSSVTIPETTIGADASPSSPHFLDLSLKLSSY